MLASYTVQEFLLTHGSWSSLRQRCYDSRCKSYPRYGGRGIVVDPRWLGRGGFENFIADVGPRPGREFSLDRFPHKDGNYEPGNVRWATAKEQAANTRSAVLLTHDGLSLPIAEWGRRTGLHRATIQARLKQSWTVARTLTTPPNKGNPAYQTFAGGRAKGKKLTAADVGELVVLARSGKWTATALGEKYSVTPTAVCHVAKQYGIKFKKGRPCS